MIWQTLKMAWSAIASNKMRSFLTMLGIIIGVVAVVVLISLVNGATNTITGEIEALGSNQITVMVTDDRGHPLSLADVEAFADEEEIGEVAPSVTVNAMAKHGGKNAGARIYGTTNAYSRITGVNIEYGRFIKSADVASGASVAVIEQDMALDFFGRTSVVGESLYFNGREFLIIGVLAKDASMSSSMMKLMSGNTSTVYVPYTVASRMGRAGSVTTFYASSADPNDMSAAQKKLESLLLQRFRQDEDAFFMINQSTIMDTMSSVTGTMTILLGGIAGISLLVGGIGIMNIMLVSVTERTREIGIRKAIGATRANILVQFLVESLAVSLLGGLIGLGVSWLILSVVQYFAGSMMSFAISGGVVALALGFSSFIGIAFGLYPANKAAGLHPIEALRHE